MRYTAPSTTRNFFVFHSGPDLLCTRCGLEDYTPETESIRSGKSNRIDSKEPTRGLFQNPKMREQAEGRSEDGKLGGSGGRGGARAMPQCQMLFGLVCSSGGGDRNVV